MGLAFVWETKRNRHPLEKSFASPTNSLPTFTVGG